MLQNKAGNIVRVEASKDVCGMVLAASVSLPCAWFLLALFASAEIASFKSGDTGATLLAILFILRGLSTFFQEIAFAAEQTGRPYK